VCACKFGNCGWIAVASFFGVALPLHHEVLLVGTNVTEEYAASFFQPVVPPI
jgi:hypothetical protein